MALLIEAISVVVRIASIQARYPGGWESFKEEVPNQTLCADANLVRVGFMNPADVKSFISDLEKNNLVFLKNNEAIDIAVADQLNGFTVACNWAECGTVELDDQSIKACRAVGDESGTLVSPADWKYEGSLSQTYSFAPTEYVDRSLKFIRHEDGLDVYLNTLTGEEAYVGRTRKS